MNGSIFRDAENGDVLAVDCWHGEGDANRQDQEEEREYELAKVVFPQGKHEHILARGLFRQIGDCCGGERKGSSPPPSPLPAPSLTPLPSVAHCHQHTALRYPPRHKHDALAFGTTIERDTPKSAVLAGREGERENDRDETAIQTDEEQRRKWQSREREILNAA